MSQTLPQFLLEINTRVWLRELKLSSLSAVPDSVIDGWARLGFDAVWLMGVWLPSPAGREIARRHKGLVGEFNRELPDLQDDDVTASPYAIRGYEVSPELGGDEALAHLRRRMNARGIRLILDFIPNHIARDHPWVFEYPGWLVRGTGADLQLSPRNWFQTETRDGAKIIAHGRDPYFDGWSDTAQLDYRNPELREAQVQNLLRLSEICDGVRCDMAMLVTNDVFDKTWPISAHGDNHRAPFKEFWPEAIAQVKEANPEFVFIAEVYWNLEKALNEMGFDLTYDKAPLDRIVKVEPLTRERFDLPRSEHDRRVHFLENHDERRIASLLDRRQNLAAAALLYSLPGTRMIYDGQLEGRKHRIPVQLLREPNETPDQQVRANYENLLTALHRGSVLHGDWKLLSPRTAWQGNTSHERIIGMAWDQDDLGDSTHEHTRVFVNWSSSRSQCWVDIALGNLAGKEVTLRDLLSSKSYVRGGVELMMRGFYLDMEPYEAHIFDCEIRIALDSTLG